MLNEKEQTSDAPDHQVAVYEFENFTCVWEHRQFGDNQNEKHKIGAYFYGTKGTLHIGWRDGWTFYPADQGRQDPARRFAAPGTGRPQHQAALGRLPGAIEQRRAPVAGIELAHRSNVLPLLGMISWRVGRSIQWDGAKEQIVGDAEANQLQARPYRAPWIYPAI